MGNSKNYKKDRYNLDDEEVITKKPKFSPDKNKEKRIKRALKTKNINDLLEEDNDFREEEVEENANI